MPCLVERDEISNNALALAVHGFTSTPVSTAAVRTSPPGVCIHPNPGLRHNGTSAPRLGAGTGLGHDTRRTLSPEYLWSHNNVSLPV